MNKPHIYIFGGLAVVICILAVATLSYAGGSKVRIPLVTAGIETLFENFKAPKPENLAVPSNNLDDLLGQPKGANEDTATSTKEAVAVQVPGEWKNFSYNGFTFEIPAEWEAAWPSEEAGYATLLFQNNNNQTVATIVSPPPTTGYPGFIITKEEKLITGKGWTHKAEIWHGDPEPGAGDTYLDTIIVSRMGYESRLKNPYFDQGYGIQFFSQYDGDASEIFKLIYSSIATQDKWQIYESDVFSFDYPNNWIVVSDAGAGHRNVEFFDQNNKLAASFECPIPETGYEGFDMTEIHRTLKIGEMQYALDYWHGDEMDYGRDDLELILMETMTPKEGMEGGIFGTACQLISEQPDMQETFERIHQSVNVRTSN
jgi:hypothetical protein